LPIRGHNCPKNIEIRLELRLSSQLQRTAEERGACVYPYEQITLRLMTKKSDRETKYKGKWYDGENCSD